MPITPSINGNIIIPKLSKTNVFKKDIRADILPFENAVNIPDIKILVPTNKKAKEYIFKPSIVMLNTFVPGSVKKLTKKGEAKTIAIHIKTDIVHTNLRLKDIILFNIALSLFP